MATNSTSSVDVDTGMEDAEINSGNGVHSDEGKEESDGYKRISEVSNDDIRGMEFETEKEAIEFYGIYAKFHGFAVRKDDVQRDYNGNIVVRQLVCNKQGRSGKKRKLNEDEARYRRPTIRSGCRARLRVAYDFIVRKWRVSVFEPSHNHDLTPTRFVHLIPKYRQLSEADKELVSGLHAQGVRSCHILGFMMGQKGGHTGLGFIKKDLYNYIDHQGRVKIEEGDAFAALSYFQGKADNDTTFFSEFTFTDDGRLENLFWADSTSRFDYECFGDVVAFDTTYRKNRYHKPLVIFCGYNHHGETTIFACALVSNEKKETYLWVLNMFSKAMYGKHPKALVTDGDKAMREAIKVVFPNSMHRLCSWHLHQNACEHVKNPKFLDEFKSLMYSHYTPEKFESEWKRVIDSYGVSKNKWIRKTYKMKRMWASAYMREQFFCGIRTTSICEGVNSFIKKYVQCKNSLVDFLHNFERAVKEYRHNELMSDFKSFYYQPVLTTTLQGIELGASKIFTSKMFKEVRNVIEDVAALKVVERTEVGNNVMLKVTRFQNKDSVVLVHFDKMQIKFVCDCRHFERRGLPCSHIICAMKHEDMDMFPDSLICKRWTKSAKADHISSFTSQEGDDEKMFMFRRGALSAAFNSLCDVSCKQADDYKEALEGINSLCDKINRRRDGNGNGKLKSNSSVVGDPLIVKTKGAPRKRKSFHKKKRCSHCRKTGHTIRKCPVLAGRDFQMGDEEEVSPGESDNDSESLNVSISHDMNHGTDSVAVSNDRYEDVGKSCGSKHQRKAFTVGVSTQDSINKRTTKQVENEDFGVSNVNVSNTNTDTRKVDASVTPNITINIENNRMTPSYGYGNPTIETEGQNADSGYYFPMYNGVPNHGISIFPQFPTAGIPSHAEAPIYPQSYKVPHYLSFMTVLGEVERSAKMANKRD